MGSKRLIVILAVFAVLAFCLAGCGAQSSTGTQDAKEPLHVAAMKGPTAIGLAQQMQEQADKQSPTYEYTVAASADELVPQISTGSFDFALVPANVAANVYRQTDGAMRVIGINTLGVLYGVAYDADVTNIKSLAGRTIYMTGKGAVPEYTVAYLLQSAGVADEVTIEFASEPSEALARLANDHSGVAIVPEPFATTALAKDTGLLRALDLTKLWDASSAGSKADGRLVTGVTIAKSELIDDDPEAVAAFLDSCGQSVNAANDDPSSIAAKLIELGILGNESIAQSAVPRCNVVCITGEEMKNDLSGYLAALMSVEPSSIGGQLPDDGFYYIGA